MNEQYEYYDYHFNEKWDKELWEPAPDISPSSFIDAYIAKGMLPNPGDIFSQGDTATIATVGYDSGSSEDMAIDVLIPDPAIPYVSSGMLVRIDAVDGLPYLGRVNKGPFTEPNGIGSNHPLVVTANVVGGEYMPAQHGRAEITLLGQITDDLTIEPCFQRPPPISSKIKRIPDVTLAKLMNFRGASIGTMSGSQLIAASYEEDVLDVHTGIVGSTGAGKSISGARMVWNAATAGTAIVSMDKDGDLAFANEPASDPGLLHVLEAEGIPAEGLNSTLYVIAGRKTRNPQHPNIRVFSLAFHEISPHVLAQIMNLNEPQAKRFWEAFAVTVKVMKRFGILPSTTLNIEESQLLDSGVPGMTFSMFRDVMAIAAAVVGNRDIPTAISPKLAGKEGIIADICDNENLTKNVSSWGVVLGEVGKLKRLGIFDHPDAPPLDFRAMLAPGTVNIFDFSDTDELSMMNNLVISRMLRGVRLAQEAKYNEALELNIPLDRALIFLEEAQEFLSKNTIQEMPEVFRQLQRTALRGRKRRLGLVITSQLPDKLPDEVIGLCNNWLIHKVTSQGTISRLKAVVGNVADAHWNRVTTLTKGQAIAVFPDQWTEPTLVKVSPPPFRVLKVM